MNKPAPKEPSMDEILSSIRQIIADDDAAGASRRPSIQAAPDPMQATPAAPGSVAQEDDGPDLNDVLEEIEPLALSPDQIVGEDSGEGDGDPEGMSFDDILADTTAEDDTPGLVDPEDIAFDPEPADTADSDADTQAFATDVDVEESASADQQPASKPPAPSSISSMPDPALSSDLADQLLEPATNAAVRNTFARLGTVGLGNHGLTIETMIREMLRPMLKDWLDENLPSVVERLVEKEIARVSRGE